MQNRSLSCPCHQTSSWNIPSKMAASKFFQLFFQAQYYHQNFHNFTFDSVAPRILWIVPICLMGLPLNLTDKRNPHIWSATWSMESRDIGIFDNIFSLIFSDFSWIFFVRLAVWSFYKPSLSSLVIVSNSCFSHSLKAQYYAESRLVPCPAGSVVAASRCFDSKT